MTNEEKFKLITRNLEEVLTEEDLRHLIDSETPLKHYIGFEISGKLHIGTFFQLMKVRDLQQAGAEVTLWLADYHSAVNDKLGGDINVIKKIAEEYFKPAMKVLFEILGGDVDKLQFKLCSEEYAKHPDFWITFLEMAKNTSLSRSKRSITILGREEAEDSIDTAKIMYPIMQAADIFLLQTNIAQAGIDQRKVHVVARDSAMQIKTNPLKDVTGNQIKPVAIHTPILLGLNRTIENMVPGELMVTSNDKPRNIIKPDSSGDQDNADIAALRMKMSKSKPGSGITIHDTPDEIRKIIKQAYAPKEVDLNNPILDWVDKLIFYEPTAEFLIRRTVENGGDITYKSFEQLKKAYESSDLHPQDLKEALAEWLIEKLEPARKYFEDPKRKAALEEIERLTSK